MRGLIYTVSFLLIAIWAIGYFIFDYGASVHILLVIAFVVLVIRMVNDIKMM